MCIRDSHWDNFQRLRTNLIRTIARRVLQIDGAPTARAKLVQQCGRERGSKSYGVDVGPFDGQTIERIGPRPLNRLAGGTPRLFLGSDDTQPVIGIELVIQPKVVLIAVDIDSVAVRQVEPFHAASETPNGRVQTIACAVFVGLRHTPQSLLHEETSIYCRTQGITECSAVRNRLAVECAIAEEIDGREIAGSSGWFYGISTLVDRRIGAV